MTDEGATPRVDGAGFMHPTRGWMVAKLESMGIVSRWLGGVPSDERMAAMLREAGVRVSSDPWPAAGAEDAQR